MQKIIKKNYDRLTSRSSQNPGLISLNFLRHVTHFDHILEIFDSFGKLWGLSPSFVGVFPLILGGFPFILGVFPLILGGFPFIVGVFPIILGVFPSFLGGFTLHFEGFPLFGTLFSGSFIDPIQSPVKGINSYNFRTQNFFWKFKKIRNFFRIAFIPLLSSPDQASDL